MKLPVLNEFAPKELLCLFGSILDELQARDIVRTSNNPVSDYTEWLVSTRLNLKLAGKSEKGFDATGGSDGLKYEIKARRVTPENPSRQLSAIRDLDGKHFDFLIAVVYDKKFEVILALKISHAVVVAKSTWQKATNSNLLHAKDSLRRIALRRRGVILDYRASRARFAAARSPASTSMATRIRHFLCSTRGGDGRTLPMAKAAT